MKLLTKRSSSKWTRAQKRHVSLSRAFWSWHSWPKTESRLMNLPIKIGTIYLISSWTMKRLFLKYMRFCFHIELNRMLELASANKWSNRVGIKFMDRMPSEPSVGEIRNLVGPLADHWTLTQSQCKTRICWTTLRFKTLIRAIWYSLQIFHSSKLISQTSWVRTNVRTGDQEQVAARRYLMDKVYTEMHSLLMGKEDRSLDRIVRDPMEPTLVCRLATWVFTGMTLQFHWWNTM